MHYLTFDEVLKVHSSVFEVSNGLDGIHNKNLLKSCVEWVKDDVYYPTFEQKLVHLVFSVATGHIFADGNKRTAIAVGAYFLFINNYPQNVCNNFPRYMENVVLRLANNEITKDELLEMIHGYLTSE